MVLDEWHYKIVKKYLVTKYFTFVLQLKTSIFGFAHEATSQKCVSSFELWAFLHSTCGIALLLYTQGSPFRQLEAQQKTTTFFTLMLTFCYWMWMAFVYVHQTLMYVGSFYERKQGFIELINFILFPWPFWSLKSWSWCVNVQGLPILITVFSFSLSALLICIRKSQKNIHGVFQSAWIFYEVPSNPQAGHLIPTETDVIESKPPNERLPKLLLKEMRLDDYDYDPRWLSVNCWISLVRPSRYWTLHFAMIICLDLAGGEWLPHMWLFKKLQRKLYNNV